MTASKSQFLLWVKKSVDSLSGFLRAAWTFEAGLRLCLLLFGVPVTPHYTKVYFSEGRFDTHRVSSVFPRRRRMATRYVPGVLTDSQTEKF